MAKSELERLVQVETKVDTLIEGVRDLRDKLELAMPTVVNHAELAEYKTQMVTTISEIKQTQAASEIKLLKELEQAKRKSVLQTWLTGTLSAVMGALLAILIRSYFTK